MDEKESSVVAWHCFGPQVNYNVVAQRVPNFNLCQTALQPSRTKDSLELLAKRHVEEFENCKFAKMLKNFMQMAEERIQHLRVHDPKIGQNFRPQSDTEHFGPSSKIENSTKNFANFLQWSSPSHRACSCLSFRVNDACSLFTGDLLYRRVR